MPLAANRQLTPITKKAHAHMKRIVLAHQEYGNPETNTHWLSQLIISQPIPNINGNGAGKAPLELPAASETAREPGGKS